MPGRRENKWGAEKYSATEKHLLGEQIGGILFNCNTEKGKGEQCGHFILINLEMFVKVKTDIKV